MVETLVQGGSSKSLPAQQPQPQPQSNSPDLERLSRKEKRERAKIGKSRRKTSLSSSSGSGSGSAVSSVSKVPSDPFLATTPQPSTPVIESILSTLSSKKVLSLVSLFLLSALCSLSPYRRPHAFWLL